MRGIMRRDSQECEGASMAMDTAVQIEKSVSN